MREGRRSRREGGALQSNDSVSLCFVVAVGGIVILGLAGF